MYSSRGGKMRLSKKEKQAVKREKKRLANQQCQKCWKTFFTHQALISHELKHLDFVPYYCSECGKEHSLDNSLMCSMCPRKFTSLKSLTHHTSKVHEASVVLCPTCGVGFPSESTLRIHVSLCRSMSVFKQSGILRCSKCRLEFTEDNKLIDHIFVVHLQGEDNICCRCGDKFYSELLLKNHDCSAKLLVCVTCSRWKFTTEKQLKVHKKEHVGEPEKKNTCYRCNSTFAFAHDLIQHKIDAHPSQFQYDCRSCYFLFTNKKDYLRHEQNAHRLVCCRQCNVNFVGRKELWEHEMKVHGVKSSEFSSQSGSVDLDDDSDQDTNEQFHDAPVQKFGYPSEIPLDSEPQRLLQNETQYRYHPQPSYSGSAYEQSHARSFSNQQAETSSNLHQNPARSFTNQSQENPARSFMNQSQAVSETQYRPDNKLGAIGSELKRLRAIVEAQEQHNDEPSMPHQPSTNIQGYQPSPNLSRQQTTDTQGNQSSNYFSRQQESAAQGSNLLSHQQLLTNKQGYQPSNLMVRQQSSFTNQPSQLFPRQSTSETQGYQPSNLMARQQSSALPANQPSHFFPRQQASEAQGYQPPRFFPHQQTTNMQGYQPPLPRQHSSQGYQPPSHLLPRQPYMQPDWSTEPARGNKREFYDDQREDSQSKRMVYDQRQFYRRE